MCAIAGEAAPLNLNIKTNTRRTRCTSGFCAGQPQTQATCGGARAVFTTGAVRKNCSRTLHKCNEKSALFLQLTAPGRCLLIVYECERKVGEVENGFQRISKTSGLAIGRDERRSPTLTSEMERRAT
jgi:hypothetical protein